jgi:hypothetical protein
LSTTYKILSNILLSRLVPYAEEITGDHLCGFRRSRSTTDHIFCIRQILEKEWEQDKTFKVYSGSRHVVITYCRKYRQVVSPNGIHFI